MRIDMVADFVSGIALAFPPCSRPLEVLVCSSNVLVEEGGHDLVHLVLVAGRVCLVSLEVRFADLCLLVLFHQTTQVVASQGVLIALATREGSGSLLPRQDAACVIPVALIWLDLSLAFVVIVPSLLILMS